MTFQTRRDWDEIWARRSQEEKSCIAVSRKSVKANATMSKVIMGNGGLQLIY